MDKTLKGFTMLALYQSGERFPTVSTISKNELEEISSTASVLLEKCKSLKERATLNETIEAQQMMNHASDLVSWTEELYKVLVEEGKK